MKSKKNSKAMQLRDVPKELREALVVHEILRRLGFDSKDIFLVYYADCVAIHLQTQDKKFIVNCGKHTVPNITEEQFGQKWTKIVEAWNGTSKNAMSNTTKSRIMDESELMKIGVLGLCEAIIKKGIVINEPNLLFLNSLTNMGKPNRNIQQEISDVMSINSQKNEPN